MLATGAVVTNVTEGQNFSVVHLGGFVLQISAPTVDGKVDRNQGDECKGRGNSDDDSNRDSIICWHRFFNGVGWVDIIVNDEIIDHQRVFALTAIKTDCEVVSPRIYSGRLNDDLVGCI